MTVTYTGSVGTASLKAFILALFKWRGSVWKAVWVVRNNIYLFNHSIR